MKTKRYYEVYWVDCYGKKDKIAITDNTDKWLEENNKERIADGFDADDLEDFIFIECEVYIYDEKV